MNWQSVSTHRGASQHHRGTLHVKATAQAGEFCGLLARSADKADTFPSRLSGREKERVAVRTGTRRDTRTELRRGPSGPPRHPAKRIVWACRACEGPAGDRAAVTGRSPIKLFAVRHSKPPGRGAGLGGSKEWGVRLLVKRPGRKRPGGCCCRNDRVRRREGCRWVQSRR
jgi:hypothetical protein